MSIMARTVTTLTLYHLRRKVTRVCPVIRVKLSAELRWNRTDLRKIHVLVEKPVPMPFYLPQIPNELFWARTLSAAFRKFPLNNI